MGLAVCANDTFDNELAARSTREANAMLADQPPSALRAQVRAGTEAAAVAFRAGLVPTNGELPA